MFLSICLRKGKKWVKSLQQITICIMLLPKPTESEISVSVTCLPNQIFQRKGNMFGLYFQMSLFNRKCHLFSRNMELNNIIMKLQWTSGCEFDLPVVHSSFLRRNSLALRNRKVIWASLGCRVTHRRQRHCSLVEGMNHCGPSGIANSKIRKKKYNLRWNDCCSVNVVLVWSDIF